MSAVRSGLRAGEENQMKKAEKTDLIPKTPFVRTALVVSICALIAALMQAYFMRKAMRVDERAWVSVVLPSEFPLNGASLQAAFQIANTGKTPGKHIEGDVIATVLNKGDIPSLGDFSIGHPHNRLYPVGIIYPGSSPIPMTIPLVKYGALAAETIVPDETLRKDIADGNRFIIFYGRITYDDVFGIHHWSQFCVGSGVGFQGDTARDCLKSNNADPDEE
jgi:hypothetical protein